MHPTLDLSNISKLPYRIQRLARTVVDPTGSVRDTLRLREHASQLPSAQGNLLLPVFYMNLDLARIPSLDQLDSPVSLRSDYVSKAYASVLAIYTLENFEPDVFVEIFSRLWPWVRFVHTYCNYLDFVGFPSGLYPSEQDISFRFLLFIGEFQVHAACAQVIGATPGLCSIVGGAWAFLVDDVLNPDVRTLGFGDLAGFMLGPLVASSPTNLEDLVDGVEKDENSNANELGPLATLLLPQGFVKALTVAAAAASLASVAYDNTDSVVECLAFLRNVLSTSHGCALLPEAIQNGLLYTLVMCGARGIESTHVTYFLSTILPASLVHHTVLRDIKGPLLEVADVVSTEAFRRSEMSDAWQEFHELALQRLEVLNTFLSREHASLKACDNVQVCPLECLLHNLSQFGSSAALNVYVYTIARGSARSSTGNTEVIEAPVKRTAFSLSYWEVLISPRDRAFIRMLLHHDYAAARPAIYLRIILFMKRHPGKQFVVAFDYTAGAAAIEVQSVDAEGLLEYDVRRGGARLSWILPLRRACTHVYEKLQAIAQELPPGPAHETWDSPVLS
ncbi:hypothetical protein C8R44DRAFT_867298 [Mycena epipterygia]|nr:hypothetical protein C8R44DRAFT_867298 [Mycena epipterygia]